MLNAVEDCLGDGNGLVFGILPQFFVLGRREPEVDDCRFVVHSASHCRVTKRIVPFFDVPKQALFDLFTQ